MFWLALSYQNNHRDFGPANVETVRWRRSRTSFSFSVCAFFVPRRSSTPTGTAIRRRLRSSVP